MSFTMREVIRCSPCEMSNLLSSRSQLSAIGMLYEVQIVKEGKDNNVSAYKDEHCFVMSFDREIQSFNRSVIYRAIMVRKYHATSYYY